MFEDLNQLSNGDFMAHLTNSKSPSSKGEGFIKKSVMRPTNVKHMVNITVVL